MYLIFKTLKLAIPTFILSCIICNTLSAQKIEFNKGYYLNQNNEKIYGYFDLELFRENSIVMKNAMADVKSTKLDINTVQKIVLEKGEKDSSVFITTFLTYKGTTEKIYLEHLIKGDVNLLRGFSKNEKELFFITSVLYPDLKRINKSDPQAFLFTYFSKCNKDNIKIKSVFYNQTSLTEAIERLASCSDYKRSEKIDFVQYDFFKKFSIGVKAFGGTVNSQINSSYFKEEFKTRSVSKGGGLSFQFNATNRIILSTGIEYFTNHLTATDSLTKELVGEWTAKFRFKTLPEVSYSKINFVPIEIRYQFLGEKYKFQPNFSLGFNISKTSKLQYTGEFNKNYTVEYSPSYPSSWVTKVPNTPQLEPIVGSRGVGLFVSAGAKRQFNKHFALNLGFRYMFNQENIQTYTVTNFDEIKTNFINKVHYPSLYAQLIFSFK